MKCYIDQKIFKCLTVHYHEGIFGRCILVLEKNSWFIECKNFRKPQFLTGILYVKFTCQNVLHIFLGAIFRSVFNVSSDGNFSQLKLLILCTIRFSYQCTFPIIFVVFILNEVCKILVFFILCFVKIDIIVHETVV